MELQPPPTTRSKITPEAFAEIIGPERLTNRNKARLYLAGCFIARCRHGAMSRAELFVPSAVDSLESLSVKSLLRKEYVSKSWQTRLLETMVSIGLIKEVTDPLGKGYTADRTKFWAWFFLIFDTFDEQQQALKSLLWPQDYGTPREFTAVLTVLPTIRERLPDVTVDVQVTLATGRTYKGPDLIELLTVGLDYFEAYVFSLVDTAQKQKSKEQHQKLSELAGSSTFEGTVTFGTGSSLYFRDLYALFLALSMRLLGGEDVEVSTAPAEVADEDTTAASEILDVVAKRLEDVAGHLGQLYQATDESSKASVKAGNALGELTGRLESVLSRFENVAGEEKKRVYTQLSELCTRIQESEIRKKSIFNQLESESRKSEEMMRTIKELLERA